MTQDPASLDFSDSTARRAFRLLLRNPAPISATELAQTGSGERQVREVFAALRTAGRAEFDDDDRLLGVYGLTLKPTEHRLTLADTTFFVWCAFDSVGIPAALKRSAEVSSLCAHCGHELDFTIDTGTPPGLPVVISWLPQRCDSVRDEFCPTVNFYCDEAHYRAATTSGSSASSFLTLEEAAAIGRANWGWAIEND